MDWWLALSRAAAAFLDEHALVASFLLLLVEEAGLPIPLPGDFLMVLLGVHAAQGSESLLRVIVALEAATVAGATFLYVVARLVGRSLVYRHGWLIRLTPARLDRAQRWLQRRGFWSVFLGRLLPGLRIVTAIACGVCTVPARVYLPAMSLGALLYILSYTLLGYLIGPPVLALFARIGHTPAIAGMPPSL